MKTVGALLAFVLTACEARIVALPQNCVSDEQCKRSYSCDLGTGRCEVKTGGDCTEGEITCSRDVGACRKGKRKCLGGAWSECSGVMPRLETCNLQDDDCDDAIDEDFPTLAASCSQGRGACVSAGNYVCREDGIGTLCNAVAIEPSREACNGVDDDCDGLIDNNVLDAPACPLTLGVCTGSRQSCASGSFQACTPNTYGASYDASLNETACDGLDNDCDGNVDEGYALQPGDVKISEVVACPIQPWCDGPECGTGALVPGGNGVSFDAYPGVTDLAASVSSHVWLEIVNQKACALSLANISIAAGPVGSLVDVALSATTSITSEGTPCTTLSPNGYCLIKAPAALLGLDDVGFTRRVEVRHAATVIDTFNINDPNGCSPGCRTLTQRRNGVSPCCDSEAYVRNGTGVVKGMATPLQPASITLDYTPALASEVVISEVLAIDAALDVNGDGTSDVDGDDFIEVAALQNINLGRASLEHDVSGSYARVHDFACFVPLTAGQRLAVFGGSTTTVGAHAVTSSMGTAAFALPRATAFSARLRDRQGNELGHATLSATDLAGASIQSRTSCGLGEDDLSPACTCKCAGQPAACVPECEAVCESAPSAAEGCFSPSTVK